MKTISLVALAMAFAMPVLAQGPSAKPGAPGTAMSSAATQGKLVDINSASESDLDALPGVGKARADAIIKHRPYSGKDDLLSRHVIPKSVYDGIKNGIVARQK